MRYDAIIFDLFNTVAIWRLDRLPLFEWRGKGSFWKLLGHIWTPDKNRVKVSRTRGISGIQ